MQKRRLGKGLGALINAAVSPVPTEDGEATSIISIAAVKPNRYQPRRNFDHEKLAELMASIREKGVIQPIIVNRMPGAEGYELIAGERRLRAVKQLGWTEIPCIIRAVDNRERLELALIENLQREDLNPIEEARAYKQLTEEFKLSHSEAARKVGKNRSTVTNMVRLLNLPEEIQDLLQQGVLSVGHARPLLAIPNTDKQITIADQIVERNLSVREAEVLVQNLTKRKKKETLSRTWVLDPHLQNLQSELQRVLGTKVLIKRTSKEQGKIEITFFSTEDFERVIERLVAI